MIFKKLMKILKDVMPSVDTDKVTQESELVRDLGINSLSMMLLALLVEEEFDIVFEGDRQFVTVGEICDYIGEKSPVPAE